MLKILWLSAVSRGRVFVFQNIFRKKVLGEIGRGERKAMSGAYSLSNWFNDKAPIRDKKRW